MHLDTLDTSTQQFIDNPYLFYSQLRVNKPVHKMNNGCWILTRYSDINAALKNKIFSNAPHPFSLVHTHNKEKYPAAKVANNLMAFMDTPEHERVRKPLMHEFHTLLRLSKNKINRRVHSIMESLPKGQPFDFLENAATPIALECICDFVGIDVSSKPQIVKWSRMLFYLFHHIPSQEVLQDVNTSLLEFEDFIREELLKKQQNPGEDLLSSLLNIESMSPDEVIHNVMLIIADGIGNVDVGLTLGINTLLSNPEQFKQLHADPSLIKSAIAECLRYDSPAQYQGRILTEDFTIDGIKIPAHSIVLLAFASANRDPDYFEDADQFLINRSRNRHLSFGSGAHACLGAGLVTLQFEALFEALTSTSLQLQLEPQEIQWVSRAGHRWPASLITSISL